MKPFLLRDVTLSKTHIAFSYGRNIWVVKRDGSDLFRLTSAGHESNPALSPDGSHIAFIGEYEGPRGVFVVPIAGGEPRRLTNHPADLGVRGSGDTVGWAPDGKHVLFSSHRAAYAGGGVPVVQLFTVPIEGGFATPVPLVRAAYGSFSPDGKRIAYVPHIQAQPECKRYRGGQARSIWIANLSDSKIEAKIQREDWNDFNPMWATGDTIYFLSDRNGPVTLFSYDVNTHEIQEIVKNNGFDIKSAAATSDAIAYEQFGKLHLLELKSGADRTLDVRPVADFPEVRPHFQNVSEMVVSEDAGARPELKISPTGARAVFAVRGNILTVPAEKGDIRNLSEANAVDDRDPAWSPDGESIAYFSDESGEYALHIRSQNGNGPVRIITLGEPPTFYYSPRWSPDCKKIGYVDKRLNYWYVDIEAKVPVRIDTDMFTDPGRGSHGLQLSWSPDSRWIAYTKQLESHLHAVFVHSIEQQKSYQLTDGMSDALYVAFDKEGQYLYFTASVDVGLGSGWLDMSSLRLPITRSVHALVLKKSSPPPVVPESDEEKAQPSGPWHRDATAPETVTVEIDFDSIAKRIVPLPAPARNYKGLFAGKPGVLFLVEAPEVEGPFGYGNTPQKVHRLDLTTGKNEQILEDVFYFDLSANGEKMLYSKSGGKKRRQFFITATEKQDDKTSEPAKAELNLDSIEVFVDPRAEWTHIFDQVWRIQRDFFYDPGLHGVNLDEVKRTYSPFLENIVAREDLDYLFAEMLATMTVLHMGAYGPDARKPKESTTGLLGADYAVENGRYRFTRIYEADPWNSGSRSPLCEPGLNVNVGDYLLAVNAQDVDTRNDVYSYFPETVGKRIVLKIGSSPDGNGSRDIVVTPIEDEAGLRHFAWTEDNRRKVEELSGGRVAYVYVPDTTLGGFQAFNRYFFAQVGKDAAIIDERYNNGGHIADFIITHLSRTLLCHWHMREGRDISSPIASILGPKVMLINETAGSGGDCLPWMFRHAGVGPLIGTRTWGGLVGHYTSGPALLDGGSVASPNLGFYTPDGAWEVENFGVQPDIEVDDDPKASRSGHDVQLEKAVEVVLGLLKANPPPITSPEHPPYPNYHHTNGKGRKVTASSPKR